MSMRSVCTPYRGNLVTGRYGFATGVNFNDSRLPDEEIELAVDLDDDLDDESDDLSPLS